MLNELTSNDVLLRINIIELLSRLVTQKHGYMYLESQGFVAKVINQLNDDSDVISQQLCEPGMITLKATNKKKLLTTKLFLAILKFFGAVAVTRPDVIVATYPKVIDRIFSNLESDNISILGVSLDTLGNIAITDKGKFALESSSGIITGGTN